MMCARLASTAFAAATAMALVALPAPAATHAPAIKGTGGSAATRVLAQWNFLFAKEHGINVEYATANSSVGLKEAAARTVDFACTEIPMPAEELAKNNLLQFPLLIGGVTPVVNIAGVGPGTMRLNASLLARIYLGEIRNWNHPDIKGANPGLTLPSLPIRLIVREDPASTTLAFTTHLAKNDRAWAERVGAHQLPKWPAGGEAVKGTSGVAEKVRTTAGAIGFVNYDEAYRSKLTTVQLRNKAGQYLPPSTESFQSTAAAAGLGRGVEQPPLLVDLDGRSSWPIVYITYVIVDRAPRSAERARSTMYFFYSSFLKGDAMAAETGFVPLPTNLQAKIVGQFRDVLGPNNQPLDFLK